MLCFTLVGLLITDEGQGNPKALSERRTDPALQSGCSSPCYVGWAQAGIRDADGSSQILFRNTDACHRYQLHAGQLSRLRLTLLPIHPVLFLLNSSTFTADTLVLPAQHSLQLIGASLFLLPVNHFSWGTV